MRKLATILFMATLSLADVASSALAQQPGPQNDLLPPRVESIATRATQLYLGMSEDEVARAMGEPTTVVTSESAGVELRVLKYAPERLPIKVTLSDGKISAVAFDIAEIDNPALPGYGRPVWSGMHRTAVLRIMGAPSEDRLRDSFGMKLEHMIFERPGLPDLSIFLVDDRVVTKQAGRALPPDIFRLSLPLAPSDADRATGSQGDQSRRRQIRAGMNVHDAQAMFGEPKMRVPYSVKGRPAEYRIYQTASDGQFACFTFIDDILVGFADGGRIPLDQILNGG
ncbi:MAG: hypothetical protein JOY90_25575 [Bradyrhizobium sp.]|uniref:hypothetical protein n=1 Tax=Bradyrhizobium sp. TaxID=376 RepID=UPI001DAE9F90|nr:hypothetical protein [Bradyrhizobium sp.]MBV9563786.1 hypothetical protein [Bradyrhizobium sp.]